MQDKISQILRSLFRYYEFKNTNAPDILIETEAAIIESKFVGLSAYEIYTVMVNWEKYKDSSIVREEMDCLSINSVITKSLKSTN